MNTDPSPAPRSRRGMLLLMVLGVLTLFLLMGSLAIILAMRARESAQAFSKAVAGTRSRPALARAPLDEALLVLIRGSRSPQAKLAVTESLLGDMFGSPPKPVHFVDEAHDSVESDAFLTGFSAGRPPEVDNDGDGQPDGVWLVGVLPPMSSGDGGQVTFRVSYLVQDLDGRINVNAHGSPDANAPLGPASVDASDDDVKILSTTVWQRLMSNSTIQRRATASTTTQWRPAPALGSTTVEGRFGKGTAATYATRLDREAPRPAVISGAADSNPFTPGELERVLRPFDADTFTLPPRLAAVLDDEAEKVRRLVTTDSWDVTGKVGLAARGLAAPEPRVDLNSDTDNSGLKAVLQAAGWDPASNDDARKWVANVAAFRTRNPQGFTSVGELLTIPIDPAGGKNLSLAATERPGRQIFDAVTVPSRFAATIVADPRREPGRVNVNTCDEQVWEAVCGKGGVRRNRPYDSLWKLLTDTAGFTTDVDTGDRDLANRLASIATIRSNVYAVWITVEISDSSPTAPPPSCHRLFAIVDRSIPVQYAEGQNNDVRETIRLKRFLD